MGRMQEKQHRNKQKWKIRAVFLLLVLLLFSGLLLVDGAHREIMGRYEEAPVLGYERQGDIHTLLFAGESYRLNLEEVRETLQALLLKGEQLLEQFLERVGQ